MTFLLSRGPPSAAYAANSYFGGAGSSGSSNRPTIPPRY
jgi:hypothetical protein